MTSRSTSFVEHVRLAVNSSPLLRSFALPVARRLRDAACRLRYASADGYSMRRYWEDKHKRYGFDLRGVGLEGLSHEQNRAMYQEAGQAFLKMCRSQGLRFENVRMLDVGCGTGFYAELFRTNGGTDYSGVDVADVLLPELRRRFPGFSFRRLDITKDELEGTYDLIAMIDVTQHIVCEKRFAFAMANVRNHLSSGGAFIFTSWLSPRRQHRQFYEVARPLSDYRKHFPNYRFSPSIPFRDKFILAIGQGKQRGPIP